MDHLDDRPHPLALGPEPVGEGAFVLDLGGGVRPVAELVLEAQKADAVAAAVFEPARHEKAGEAAAGARERQESVRHRRRAEPLVAGETVAPSIGLGPRRVRADVGAALLFGHRHPQRRAAFLRHRRDGGVVVAREELRPPERLERRIGAERGDGGVGHRHRAAGAGLGLARHVDHRGVGRVAARRVLPGDRRVARAEPRRHQVVVGRVEGDLVEPPPARVEEPEFRRCPVRRPSRLARRGAPVDGPELGQRARVGPARMIAQHRVVRPEVRVAARGRLVRHIVGGKTVLGSDPLHRAPPACDDTGAGPARNRFSR